MMSIVTKSRWPTGGLSHWDKATMWWTIGGGMLAVSALLLWVGLRIATRNLHVVLGPQRD